MKSIPRSEFHQHVKEMHQSRDKRFELDDQVRRALLLITIAMETLSFVSH